MENDIRSLNLEELRAALEAMGEKPFTASQIFDWLHSKQVFDFDSMTNVSKQLRKKLSEEYSLYNVEVERKLVSKLDGTVKYLFRLHDGNFIETVVMKYKYGFSICLSSQVGCKMGCAFCASTIAGFVRDLTAGEMVCQLYRAQAELGERISHIVLMGVGEPLDNFENVMRFLELVTCEKGQNISMRSVSLSTCGIVPRINELAEKRLQLTLSISLHAPNDEIRSRTMPVNKKWGMDELLSACRSYFQKTSRRISFEYALISGVNDSEECAAELCGRLRGMQAHVNLIPVNSVVETGFKKPSRDATERFRQYLTLHGVNATVRRTLGSDINASCGQLRRTAK